MPKKPRKFRWQHLFLLIAVVALLVALYFFTYDFFRQTAVIPASVPAAPNRPSDDAVTYSHLPENAAATSVAVAVPPVVVPTPAVTPPYSPVDVSGLPSAALDLSALLASRPVSTSTTAAPSFGSFQESFVSAANIDADRTTLYRDDRAAAMFFPPDYSWEKATDELVGIFRNSFAAVTFNDFSGPYEDERCLGGNCLKLQGGELFYNGQSLARPEAVHGTNVVAVSLGTLSQSWLVGFTLQDGDNYRGRVFYFDGKKFAPLVLPKEISSSAFGLLGFGGEESDFLVIYGAAPSVAYRVRDGGVKDVSRWFSPRVMGSGFKPEVIRAGLGSDIAWYVHSATKNRPQLIKLWQNGTADIVGEAVFSGLLFNSASDAAFKLVSNPGDRVILLANLRRASEESWQVFTDRGFKNSAAATLTTKPITHDGVASTIVINRIASAKLGLDKGSAALAQFSFSEDGLAWRNVPLAPDSYFTTKKIRDYRLQVAFPAFPDRFYSPFLDSILFDYYAKKFPS